LDRFLLTLCKPDNFSTCPYTYFIHYNQKKTKLTYTIPPVEGDFIANVYSVSDNELSKPSNPFTISDSKISKLLYMNFVLKINYKLLESNGNNWLSAERMDVTFSLNSFNSIINKIILYTCINYSGKTTS